MIRPKIIIRKPQSVLSQKGEAKSPTLSVVSTNPSYAPLNFQQSSVIQVSPIKRRPTYRAEFRNKSQVQKITKQPSSTISAIRTKEAPSESLHLTLFSSGQIALPSQALFTDREEQDFSFLNQSEPGQQTITVWKSPLRPNTYTVCFPYPKITNLVRQPQFLMEVPKIRLAYKINGQVPFKCVLQSFEAAAFEQVSGDKWDVMWGMANKETLREMTKYQKINHFPGCWNIGRKDNLWINMSKTKRRFPKEYSFVPNTYLLAHDFDRFQAIRENAHKKQLWIRKPVAAARGVGIQLITKTTKITENKNYLIMDYITRPHLVNQFKYDLRVYVLLTSVDPFRVYMYQDGLVRFATQAYSTSKKDLKKRYIHLTNFSVNKESPQYVKNENGQSQGSSKWSHKEYRQKLKEMNVDSNAIFAQIEDIVVKTCIATESIMLDPNGKISEHKSNYFELFGFDIILDSELKPWLLEVNVSPSLNSSSELDGKVKTALISDMMHLVGVPYKQAKRLKAKEPYKFFQRNINDIPTINQYNFKQKVQKQDQNILMSTIEEQMRLGDFKCLYPRKDTIDKYDEFFEYPRYHNKLIQKYFQDGSNWQF